MRKEVDPKARVNIIIPERLLKELDAEALKLGISRSSYLVMCLSEYWEQKQIIRQMPEAVEALRQASEALQKKTERKSSVSGSGASEL